MVGGGTIAIAGITGAASTAGRPGSTAIVRSVDEVAVSEQHTRLKFEVGESWVLRLFEQQHALARVVPVIEHRYAARANATDGSRTAIISTESTTRRTRR